MEDIIYIKGLKTKSTIGILPHERLRRQTLIISLELGTDISAAADADDIGQALDYSQVAHHLEEFAQAAEFQLLESFATALCASLLAYFPRCQTVSLDIQKPGALSQSQQVGLKIVRRRPTDK